MTSAWLLVLIYAPPDRMTGFTRLKAMRQGFEQTTDLTAVFAWILVLLGLIGLAILLTQIANREPPAPKNPQQRYFEKALRMLQLSKREIRVLRQIARRGHLGQPTAMLLTPNNLTTAIEAAMRSGEAPKLRQQAEAIGRKVFGSDPPAA